MSGLGQDPGDRDDIRSSLHLEAIQPDQMSSFPQTGVWTEVPGDDVDEVDPGEDISDADHGVAAGLEPTDKLDNLLCETEVSNVFVDDARQVFSAG